MFKVAGIFLLAISGVSGFSASGIPASRQQTDVSSSTALNMMNVDGVATKKAAGSFLAASFLVSNLAFAAPAFAADDNMVDFGGSSQVIAGRSGGRAGGRSSAARAPSRSAAPSRSSSRVIERTTVIRQAPPVYSSPSVIVAPPPMYYNPVPGLGEFIFIPLKLRLIVCDERLE